MRAVDHQLHLVWVEPLFPSIRLAPFRNTARISEDVRQVGLFYRIPLGLGEFPERRKLRPVAFYRSARRYDAEARLLRKGSVVFVEPVVHLALRHLPLV